MKHDTNDASRSPRVWRIAPGERATEWPLCRDRGCIALGWSDMPDFRAYDNQEDLAAFLTGPRTSERGPRGSRGAPFIWQFLYDVKIGDIVVANHGESRVVGVGRIAGGYLPGNAPDNPMRGEALPHARRVEWVLNKPVRLAPKFFGHRPVTIAPIDPGQWAEIKRAYATEYAGEPGLAERLGEPHAARSPAAGAPDKFATSLVRQGFVESAKVRRAIEDHSMGLAANHFSEQGYEVEDVHKHASYDLRCIRAQVVLYVEVKGTRTRGDAVLLTPNEVALAREQYPHTALLVVSGIEVANEETMPIASGGKTRVIHPWRPTDRDLTPLGFSCDITGMT
jgi:hypothetical protein